MNTGTDIMFWACAAGGTVFFVLRVALMIIGGFGADTDAQGDGLAEAHGDIHADAHHSEALQATESSFKLLTIQSLTGFFMMFGWTGLAASRQFGAGGAVSALAGLVAGAVTMVLTASLFKLAARLTSAGDVFKIQDTVGLTATVYAQIPAGGRGQVKLLYNGLVRFLEAVSEDGSALESFKDVVIVKVVDPRTVSVRIRP